jgi:DNA-binding MarR family transcriptional regulator
VGQILSNKVNKCWADIYYYLHYVHQDPITHQAVRLLQHLDMKGKITVGDLAKLLSISHNTASEHVKRLIEKGWVRKERSKIDERKVFVVLTEQGRQVLFRNTRLDEEKLSDMLGKLSEEDKKIIEKAFSIMSKETQKCSL